MLVQAPSLSETTCFSYSETQWLIADAGATSAPACAPPRKRNRQARSKPYAHTQTASPSPCASTQSLSSLASFESPHSVPAPIAKRWPCGMPRCAKSYGRSHDLVRHLDSAHNAALACAGEEAILAAGVPPGQVARLRELLARRNACAVCGEAFSRRDALVRHLDEQAHRVVAPPPNGPAPAVAAPPGFQWALVPLPGEAAPLAPVHQPALSTAPLLPAVDLYAGLFMSPLDMHLAPLAFDSLVQPPPLDVPAAPLLRDEDLFAFPEVGAADALAVPDMPSLDDWETLISSWAGAQP